MCVREREVRYIHQIQNNESKTMNSKQWQIRDLSSYKQNAYIIKTYRFEFCNKKKRPIERDLESFKSATGSEIDRSEIDRDCLKSSERKCLKSSEKDWLKSSVSNQWEWGFLSFKSKGFLSENESEFRKWDWEGDKSETEGETFWKGQSIERCSQVDPNGAV